MQMLILFEVFDTIIDEKRFAAARDATHKQLTTILESGQVIASGAFSHQRGGFVFVEVDSGEQLLRFLAPGFNDNCKIQVFPVLPWEVQGQVLADIFGQGQGQGGDKGKGKGKGKG